METSIYSALETRQQVFFPPFYYMIWISEHTSDSGQALADGTMGDQQRPPVKGKKKSFSKMEAAVWTISIVPTCRAAVSGNSVMPKDR